MAPSGDLLVLGGAAVYSLQIIAARERFAPLHDALAFTLVEMLAAFAVLMIAAIPRPPSAARRRQSGERCS